MLFLTLIACLGATEEADTADEAESLALDVQTFDCDARCWRDDTLTVPSEFWEGWTDGSACDDAGLYLTYGDACVSTNRVCDSDWADDPEVGEGTGCCEGDIAEGELQTAPLCGEGTGR